MKTSPPNQRAVVPVLAVPTGLLWQVDYDADGSITAKPRQVDRARFFIKHSWETVGPYGEPLSYQLSHVEVVTFDAIAEATNAWLGSKGFLPLA
jgi:hypothetical protein